LQRDIIIIKQMKFLIAISDFFKYRGQWSHTRLISIVGSGIVFWKFIEHPDNFGLQDLMMAIIGFAFGSATMSKFTKENNQSINYDEGSENIGSDSIDASEVARRGRRNLR
jgi:hypothetical protein